MVLFDIFCPMASLRASNQASGALAGRESGDERITDASGGPKGAGAATLRRSAAKNDESRGEMPRVENDGRALNAQPRAVWGARASAGRGGGGRRGREGAERGESGGGGGEGRASRGATDRIGKKRRGRRRRVRGAARGDAGPARAEHGRSAPVASVDFAASPKLEHLVSRRPTYRRAPAPPEQCFCAIARVARPLRATRRRRSRSAPERP